MRRTFNTLAIFLLCAALDGCGSSLSGTYTANIDAFILKEKQKMTFTSNKVEISFMGLTTEATYKVEDGKVKITNGGVTQVFTIDDKGCLEGGVAAVKFCKE
jgi:hypothetical protein